MGTLAALCLATLHASGATTPLYLRSGTTEAINTGTTSQTLQTSAGTSQASIAFTTQTPSFDFYSAPLTSAQSLTKDNKLGDAGGGTGIGVQNNGSASFTFTVQGTAYDYDPATGSQTRIVQTTTSTSSGNVNANGGTAQKALPNTAIGGSGYTIPAGHMIKLTITVNLSVSSSINAALIYNGNSGNSDTAVGFPQDTTITWPFGSFAGPVSALASTVSASPTSVRADGSTTSTITVTLTDANSNPVSGKTVSLAKTSGSGSPTITTTQGTTDSSGHATFTVKSTTTATDTFTATDTTDNITITQIATVTFTASRLVITGSSSQMAGSSQSLTITAEDANGNTDTSYTGSKNLTFSGASSSPSPATAPTVTSSSGTTVAFGTATVINFSSGVATVSGANNGVMTLYDMQTATISVSDGTISSSGSGNLTVTVSAALASKLVMKTEPSSSATAGGTFSTQPAVYVVDQYGNQVTADSGRQVTAGVYLGTGPLSGSLTATTSGGVATFSGLGAPTLAQTGLKLKFTATGLTEADDTATSITVSGGTAAALTVESAANGTGSIVGAQAVPSGSSLTVYAITRDSYGNFVGNPSVTWSLTGVTGGVASSDLSGTSGASTTFTPHAPGPGSATMHAVLASPSLSANSGPLTVAAPGWYGACWVGRIPITIDHTKVSGDQANFPVLINSTFSALAGVARSDGYDILFTASDGTTKLNHEREKYTSASGALVAWVKVPSLSSSVDTTLYMYYGCSSASDQQNKTGVWDSDFKSVWHMGDSASPATDSTSNGDNASQTGHSPAFGQTGEIDGAALWDTSQNEYLSTSLPSATTWTIEMWLKMTAVPASGGYYSVMVPSSSLGLWIYNNNGSTKASLYYTANHVNNSSLTASTWYHLVVANNAGSVTFYLNGSPNGTASGAPTMGFTMLGGDSSGSYKYAGYLDEVRYSDNVRSAAWIATEYNNQSSPGTFYSVGSQQSEPAKLAITSVNGGANPTAGTGFSVVVQSQDASGNAANVASDTAVTLSLNTGSGALGGTLTGTISTGSSSVTISGATYTKAESGVVLTAARTSGDSLAAGNSSAFTVNPGPASKLLVASVPSSATAGMGFSVVVQSQDANGNTANVVNNTGVSLAQSGGTGTLTGNTATIPGGTSSVTLNAVQYNKVETITLTASRTSGDSLAASGASSSVNVGKATPAFSALSSRSITYGAMSVTLSGTISATGSVYPANGEPVSATINGHTVNGTFTDSTGDFSITYNDASLASDSAGSYTITYAYAGDSNLNAAPNNTSTSLTISKAALGITAKDDTKTYGQAKSYGAGSAAFTSSGLQNGESIGTVTISAGGGTAANDPVGGYNLTPSAATGGSFSAANYTITYNDGTLTVAPLPVHLTGSRAYDGTTTAAAGILSVANKVGSDNVTVASGAGTLAGASVGDQALTACGTLALGGTAANNYTLTGAGGSVTITAASTTTTVSSSLHPAQPSDSVTFTASVAVAGAGSAVPTGTVQFQSNGTNNGTSVTLTNGQASLTVSASTLGHGNIPITAVYANSDGNFSGSTNTPSLNQVVNTPPVANTLPMATSQNTPASFPTAKLLALGTSDADGDTVTLSSLSTPSEQGGTVALTDSGATITYTPKNGFSGADSFTYTVSDGFTTTTGTITVTVRQGDFSSPITPGTAPDGNSSIVASGIPGRTYQLQRSIDNMVSWATIATTNALPNGLIPFVDLDSTNHSPRFYRIAAP